MESERPQLSITLPRNFMFHYRDGQLPQTPEPESQPDELVPPPPPRQMLKVRRRRGTFAPNYPANEFHDLADNAPIPTIEAPEIHSNNAVELPALQSSVDNEFLSPPLTFGRMLSPPKTPIAQMGSLSSFDGPQQWSEMDAVSQSDTSSRPTSSGGFSDSSISSRESFESFPSLGGSCTSPEEEMPDPFEFSPVQKYPHLASPIAPRQARPPKMLKLRATFTEEMDNHLWMTYLKYLQDPTVTPFKALPSTVPPNGACHRVARLARKTWKGGNTAPMFSKLRSVSRYQSRSGTPDTIKPTKSGSSTPVPNKPYARHPDEKSTRKRLRYLARQKPTLSAHYQRLLRRSPSPFQSSPEEEPASRPDGLSSPFSQAPKTFSTRDMNMSLTTSTAPSMQAGNPLSQIANGLNPVPSESRANLRASAHQKSQSLHVGLGIGLGLQNSFQTMSHMTDISMNQHNARTWHAPSARPARLGSPLQLHSPRPISRPFKRRALHNFEEQARSRGNSFIDQVFGAPAQSSHRRVRSRGFSLGDMVEGARRLPLSTSGPTEFNPFANLDTMANDSALPSPAHSLSQEVQEQATVRLGSPFGARPNNTFPRASTSYGFEPPASFEERFAGLPHH